MSTNGAGDGLELCSADLIQEMLVESIGPDSPMTDEAVAVASLEVGARVEGARRAIEKGSSRHGNDTKAMAAVLLMDEEAGLFDGTL